MDKTTQTTLELKTNEEKYFLFIAIVRRISPVITWVFYKVSWISPNMVTFLSIFSGIGAAVSFIQSEYYLGALFAFLWMLFDCADGELARKLNRTSNLGGHLERINSDIQYIIFLPSLAIGLFLSEKITIDVVFLTFFGTASYNILRSYLGAYPHDILGEPTGLKCWIAIQFKNMKPLRQEHPIMAFLTYYLWRNIYTQGGFLYPLTIGIIVTNSLHFLPGFVTLYAVLYGLFAAIGLFSLFIASLLSDHKKHS